MACRCLLTLLLLGGFVFSTPPVFSQARNLKKIQVGVPAVSMGNIIIFFANEAKIYAKHDLCAEPIVMSGSGIASRALIAGSVTISPITTPAVMRCVQVCSDMVITAHMIPCVIQPWMAHPDIKQAKERK